MIRCLIFSAFALCSCHDSRDDESVSKQQDSHAERVEELPPAFDKLVTAIVENMNDDKKKEIVDAPMAEMMVDHFGAGLALRNGELNQTNSKVRKYLIRRGIFHRDDLSSIVLLSAVRRVRGEPIELNGQIAEYRKYWQELDEIAPLELDCLRCQKEMDVMYYGSSVSPTYPKRTYFLGSCPDDHRYLFYHKDGWRTEESVKGEQDGADQPATVPESKAEGNEKTKPKSEVRPQ